MKSLCYRPWLLLGVVLNLLVSPLYAQNIEIDAPASVQVVYKPFSGLPSAESIKVTLSSLDGIMPEINDASRTGGAIYNIRIRSSDGGRFVARSSNGGELPVGIGTSSPEKLAGFDDHYLHYIRFAGARSDARTINYDLAIRESIWAAPGTYAMSLDFEVVNAINKDQVFLLKTLQVIIIVEPNLQTNLAGQVGSFEDGVEVAIINFGKLESNESREIYVQVRGNTPARIRLSSENYGYMVNEKNHEWRVNYDVEVDGVSSSLETPLDLDRSVAKDFRGSAYPLRITVGDVAASFSGKYLDVITVDVRPQ